MGVKRSLGPTISHGTGLLRTNEGQSGSASLVAVMKPADSGNLDHGAPLGRVDFSGFWGILIGVHPWSCPGGIRNAHFADEFPDLSFGIGSAWTTTLPAPIETEIPAMPTNDGFGLDDQKS